MSRPVTAPSRTLFVTTILAGSFLLFLIQPLVARMALPRLGGAPNVWNSAMLVYQALLLAGYFYAHRLARLPLRRQAQVHLTLFALAALTLPIALADLPPPSPGMEPLWVPALLAISIGPVFFLVSAQAPLMQRWFSTQPGAGAPWALYAASNLGSFAGLIAYPLLVEPLLPLEAQRWGWSAGYVLLLVLIALCGRARRGIDGAAAAEAPAAPVPRRQVLMWLALSAVPSGLMLSTTTHLTTDIFAMPLLWVIPLGLYLLSFSIAFADRRGPARAISALAWAVVLGAGGFAMVSNSTGGLAPALASVVLLFVVCVALHARLYDLRPDPAHLTYFYLVMSAGGVLGGAFTALVAPLVFDWVWEHALLVLAAAALLPLGLLPDWRRWRGVDQTTARLVLIVLGPVAGLLAYQLHGLVEWQESPGLQWALTGGLVVLGLALAPWRGVVLAVLLATMLAQGGVQTLRDSGEGLRDRSYFGVYTVRNYTERKIRTLAHGTTLHGQQSLAPGLRLVPLTYYGPGSGAGIAFGNAARLFGPKARLGVVGLGTGSLACYRLGAQDWRFYEIDPVVLDLSRQGTFTFIRDCAPDAKVVLGDARIELAKARPGSLDLLAVDAFSSDAIPLHLMTDEAFGVYLDALSPRGILLVHISNRFIDLEPVVAALARQRGLAAALRDDTPQGPFADLMTNSTWIALSRDPAQLRALQAVVPTMPWRPLVAPAPHAWSDDHASILPHVLWENLLGS
ncbi:MAG: hypothetical protein O9283_10360 [Sphingomonadaceae bacterium]|nr:hypothetical protein [Sphingomonadaceae bacterium]